MRVEQFSVTEESFVWVQVAGVRMYSCYFSPNERFSVFVDQIDALESSLRQAGTHVLITGDFNSKSPEWGESRLDKRGELVCEMVYENSLVVVNRGHEWTFRRGQIGSILDLTVASPQIARKVESWEVLEEETLSDHQYIEFSVTTPRRAETRFRKRAGTSWDVRKMNKEKLDEFLTEARLIDELNWGRKPSTLEQATLAVRDITVAACDVAMPRRKGPAPRKNSLYWWSDELTCLRKTCLVARRRYTRSRGDPELRGQWYDARCAFKKAIKASKRRCWKDLIGEAEKDPWGLAYKLVSNKLRTSRQIPGLDRPQWVHQIIRALFPPAEPWTRRSWTEFRPVEDELFTLRELQDAGGSLKHGKASGIDGIPNEILKRIIEVFPSVLLRCFNSCLLRGEFIPNWKRQRLVLLRKSDKPLDQTSSYRPICLLDTMGKVLEGMVLQRLNDHLGRGEGLSENQFGFRKGKSTTDAIKAVVDLVEKARKGTGKRKGFCALVALDIRNAFNTARWPSIMEAMEKKGLPGYLLRMVDNYLSDRWVIYEGDGFTLREEMKCGAPQGSRIGPFLWNVMYDDFLEMDLPEGVRIIGFADDALLVCPANDVRILELRVNESLRRAKRWLDSRGLTLALEKIEALLVTDRRSFECPKIRIDTVEIAWRKSIKYLGVELDRKMNFRPHIHSAGMKASKCAAQLARMMPNVGGPREEKRRLVASAALSKLLYAAPIWASSLESEAICQRLLSAQRGIALRIISAYRTVSTSAALVLAGVPPADLLAREREAIFTQVKARSPFASEELEHAEKALIREDARHALMANWQDRWQRGETGRWTYRLIPDLAKWSGRKHGVVSYHLTQALTGHGCYSSYLLRFNKRDNGACVYCSCSDDNAEHTLFVCPHWGEARAAMNYKVGITVSPENMVELMLRSKKSWASIANFVTSVMKAKDTDGRLRNE